MAFTGFSSDEEGSIVFDGEQFIINNPDNVPPDFDPGDRPVIYTRPPVVPSTPVPPPTAPAQQAQSESTSESTQSSQTFRLGERILRRNRERARQDAAAQSKAPPLQVIDEVPDFAELGYIDSERLPVSEAPDWPGSTPLSQGQSLHVDHLLSTETDTLAREVLIGIRREGIPPEALLYDFMSQYAEWGWDDLSSAWAVQVLNMIRQSDWDEVFAHADSTPVETIAQDLGNNTREGLVIIDAGSGNVVLNKTGVRGPGGQQYVGLQDYEVEALRGLDLIFVHNHTNDTGASKDDLLSAFDAGAKLLIVITQSGREQVYIRGRYGMVEVRDAKASYKVGSPTLDETIALANKSAEQAAAYREDPPEYVFLQEDQRVKLEVSGDLFFFYGDDLPGWTYRSSVLQFAGPEEVIVLGKAFWNHFLVLVELNDGEKIWAPLNEQADETNLDKIELVHVPEIDSSGETAPAIKNPYTRSLAESNEEGKIEAEVDFLPIAQEKTIRVIPFGATGNPDWDSTEGYHIGVDILAPAGTEVNAITSGEVIGISVPEAVNLDHVYGPSYESEQRKGEPAARVYNPQGILVPGRQAFADDWVLERSGGATVIVRSGNGYTVYAHLDPNSIQVGTQVMKGQTIGTVGKDKIEGNDHLHYEFRTHGWNAILLDTSGEYVKDDVKKSRDTMPQVFLDPNVLNSDEFNAHMRKKLEGRLVSPNQELLAYDGGTGRTYIEGRDEVGQVWRPTTRIVNP